MGEFDMRIVSYNVQYCRGKDERVDIDRIVGEVAEADVIAMQEVDRYWSRSGMTDQVHEITKRLPEHYWVYGPGVDLDASARDSEGRLENRRRQFGNLLLSRSPILASKNQLLPKMAFYEQLSIQRTMLDGIIACSVGAVRVASVHLAHSAAPERLAQVRRLRELQAESGRDGGVLSGRHENWSDAANSPPWPPNSILLGDFNMTPGEQAYAAMVGFDDPKYGRITEIDGYLDAWICSGGDPNAGHTKFEDTGNRRIDYAFISPGLADGLRSVWIDSDAQGSDHQPLWMEIHV
jgi:endonuclease/exonuclease/phosphatase family metal-dependent hydrolase